MRTFGILSALLLAVIAVPALAISVLYNGIAQTILVSPSFIANVDPEIINTRYQYIAPYVVHNALTTSTAATLLPDETTRATIQPVLTQVLSTNTLTSATPMDAFDMLVTQVVTQTLRTAPPCTTDAESRIIATLARKQLPQLDCAPTTPALEQQIVDMTNQVLHQTFDSVMRGNQLVRFTSQDVTNQLNSIRTGARQSIMIPATLIIMVVALAVRSRRQLFGWISSIVVATAGIGALITFWLGSGVAPTVEQFIIQTFTQQAGILLPLVIAMTDSAFPPFLSWATRIFFIMLGGGIIGMVIAVVLPKPITMPARISTPLGHQAQIVNDGSTNRVKTDYETDAFIADPSNTLQLPPGLDTSKLTFGRRLPKIPQPTQQITDIIPAGDHTTPIPVDGQTETLNQETHTQELGPKEDSRATQRTDEHRF
ncbi:MAG: hypothetical protein ACO3F2_11965 [Roseiflexaceae bacterium]